MINLFEPNIGSDSLDQLKDVFESNWLGRGKKVALFEERLSTQLCIEKSKISTNSCCSDAIFNAIQMLDLSEDDLVIIPTNSFPAIASSILHSKANLKIVDIKKNGNIDIDKIPNELIKKASLVFITHYGGIPVNIEKLRNLLPNTSLIFEDCACALGTKVDNKPVGSDSDFSCWSLDPMKLITAGEGGVFSSNDLSFLNKVKQYSYLGLPLKEKTGLEKSSSDSNWWLYELEMPGRRSVFCDFHAAIGLPELEKIDDYLNKKKIIREKYIKTLNDLKVNFVAQDQKGVSYSNYFMTLQNERRDELAKFLKQNGIYSSLRYSPLHKMDLFKKYAVDDMKGADYFYSNSLNIPIHQNLNNEEVDFICAKLGEYFSCV